jgi:hypothetical protein
MGVNSFAFDGPPIDTGDADDDEQDALPLPLSREMEQSVFLFSVSYLWGEANVSL